MIRAGNIISSARYDASDLAAMLEHFESEIDAGGWRGSTLDKIIEQAEKVRQRIETARLMMYLVNDEGEGDE